MATARKITDFMSTGTHAARPASPTLGTGEIALYYETDTLHMFAYITGTGWVQIDSVSSSNPTIVQVASAALASHATGVTLSGAPAQGNLLVAFISDQATSPSVNTGWTNLATGSAAQDGYGIFIKIAGAGESTTQTPCSDTHQGTITIYELNNAAGGLPQFATGYSGTAVAETTISAKSTGNGLLIGVFVNRSTTGPTSITGTGVTADTAGNTTGQGRAVAPYHISSPANGNNTATANYSTSQGGVWMSLNLG